MDDLIAFLKARLDEDEAAAKAATPGPWYRRDNEVRAYDWDGEGGAGDLVVTDDQPEDMDHIARHDPARALREVEAKRAIVKRYERGASGELPEWQAGRELIEAGLAILLGVLRDLAAVYSDHPDYDEAWKP